MSHMSRRSLLHSMHLLLLSLGVAQWVVRHRECLCGICYLRQVTGLVDRATLASDGVKDTGAGLEDLMAQLDQLSSTR